MQILTDILAANMNWLSYSQAQLLCDRNTQKGTATVFIDSSTVGNMKHISLSLIPDALT